MRAPKTCTLRNRPEKGGHFRFSKIKGDLFSRSETFLLCFFFLKRKNANDFFPGRLLYLTRPDMNFLVFSTIFTLFGVRLLFGGYSVSVGTILLLGSISASAAFLVDSLFLNEEASASGNGTSTITSTDEALALATAVVREALDYFRDALARFR